MTATGTRHRFSVSEYYKMAEAGILGEDDRVELIEGEIVDMPPIGQDHMNAVNRLNYIFGQRLGERAIVSVQNPIHLSTSSVPQPDIALLRYRPDFYAGRRAPLEDVLLVVEVADTSLQYDRDIKVPLYARFGIPEVWIVDLGSETILVFRQPGPDGYADTYTVPRPGELSPQAFPDLVFATAQILG
jgi:Uma2 family endonuclease